MTDHHFDLVMVYDRLGTAVRIKPFGTASVLDPLTDTPLTVTQDGQSVQVVTADADGRASFVAQQGLVKLVDGGLVTNLTSPEAASAGATNAATAQAAQQAAEAAAAQAAQDAAAANVSADTVASAAADAASAAVEPLSTQQAQLMASAATREQACQSVFINRPGVADFTVDTAMIAQQIVDAAVLFDTLTAATSDTNYWTVSLYAIRGGATDATPMVSKTTKATGGQAITPLIPWTLTGAVWDPNLSVLAAGDVLRLKIAPTGSPGSLTMPVTFSWRPVAVTP